MRSWAIAMGAVLTWAGFISQASAEQVQVCTSGGLTLRDSPSLHGGRLAIVENGSRVEVLGRSGEWVNVRGRTRSGWVHGDYVCPVAAAGAPGSYILPLAQTCKTSEYGYRVHPISRTRTFHRGVDMRGASGTPIRAIAAGTVVFAGRNLGHGHSVIIRHADGNSTVYSHMCCGTGYRYANSTIAVRVGQAVAQGQTLGQVGTTGASTGPHLHLEARDSADRSFDPQRLIGVLPGCTGAVGGDDLPIEEYHDDEDSIVGAGVGTRH